MEVVKIYYHESTKDNQQISENFKFREIKCKCGASACTFSLLSNRTLESLESLRTKFKKSIFINSGFRCQSHNYSIGGTLKSRHARGLAVDIRPKDLKDLDLLEDYANQIFDVVLRYDSFIHCHNKEQV